MNSMYIVAMISYCIVFGKYMESSKLSKSSNLLSGKQPMEFGESTHSGVSKLTKKILLSYLRSSSGPITLFTDYDGTLAEIVNNPNDAVLTNEMSILLQEMSALKNVQLVVITGRKMEEIEAFLPKLPFAIISAYSGFVTKYPDGTIMEACPENARENIDKLARMLHEQVADVWPGAVVENKGVALTLHYRNVSEENQLVVAARTTEIIKSLGLHALKARKAVECKTRNDWGKGEACQEILERTNMMKSRVMYFGDDVADELAIQHLNKIIRNPNKLLTVKVTKYPKKATNAKYTLPNPTAVGEIFGKIIKEMALRSTFIALPHSQSSLDSSLIIKNVNDIRKSKKIMSKKIERY